MGRLRTLQQQAIQGVKHVEVLVAWSGVETGVTRQYYVYLRVVTLTCILHATLSEQR